MTCWTDIQRAALQSRVYTDQRLELRATFEGRHFASLISVVSPADQKEANFERMT